MKKRIIILTTQRTGSTWLITLLNNYKNIQEFGEPFINNNYINNIYNLNDERFEYYNYIKKNNLKNNFKNIKKYIQNLENYSESNITIFKIMYSQIKKNIRLILLLFNKNTYIIHLKRENIYESIISSIYSEKTKTTHILNKENRKINRIFINKKLLKKRKFLIMIYRSFFSFFIYIFLSKKTINIEYQELVKNKKNILMQIYKHIGMPIKIETLNDITNKILSNDYKEIIINYDEIKDLIQNDTNIK